MRKKDHIKQAIQIGEKNKRIIELAKNFCKHLRAEPSPHMGVGLVEQQTGLPISGRDCLCQYARARAVSGMDFESVAIDFYYKNCRDCDKREAVGLPNLTSIIEEKETRVEENNRSREEYGRMVQKQYEERKSKRNKCRSGNALRNSLVDLIDQVDKDCTNEVSRKLTETAKLAPEKFDHDIVEVIFELAEQGSYFKREASLEVLTILANGGKSIKDGPVSVCRGSNSNGIDLDRLVQAALKALDSHEGHGEAARVVDFWLDKRHEQYVTDRAIYALIRIAYPPPSPLSFSHRIFWSGPLLTTVTHFPGKVFNVIRELLKNDDKTVRMEAAGAAGYITEKYPDHGLEILDDLLKSIGLPDDGYDEGPASRVVAKTVSKIFENAPEVADEKIHEALKAVDSEIKGEIFQVYDEVINDDYRRGLTKVTPAKKVAAKRVLSTLNERPNDQRFDEAVSILKRAEYHGYGCYEGCEDLLITAAANIVEELKNPYSPLIDPNPTQIKILESTTRGIHLNGALDAVQECLGQLGRRKPHDVGIKVIECLKNLGSGQSRLKSTLISSLGHIGSTHDGISLVVPVINKAFTDNETIIRYAAVEAYGILSEYNSNILPSSLHENFYNALSDPYTIVHQKAVSVLRYKRAKVIDEEILKNKLLVLILAYVNGGNNPQFLSMCIDSFLSLFSRWEPISDATGKFILGALQRANSYDRVKSYLIYQHQFKHLEEFSLGLAAMVSDEYIHELNLDEVLEMLREFKVDQVIKVKDLLAAGAGKLIISKRYYSAIEILEVLSLALCWTEVLKITGLILKLIDDTVENRPLRLQMQTFHIAAKIEQSLSVNDFNKAQEGLREWNSNKEAIRKDDEENADRRRLFRGIRLPG